MVRERPLAVFISVQCCHVFAPRGRRASRRDQSTDCTGVSVRASQVSLVSEPGVTTRSGSGIRTSKSGSISESTKTTTYVHVCVRKYEILQKIPVKLKKMSRLPV